MVENPAGFWARLGAVIVDGLFTLFIFGFVGLALYGQFLVEGFSFIDILNTLYFLLLPIIWHGYTVGKKALGIRIVRIDDEKLGFGTMFMREIVAGLIYVLTFGIGFIASVVMVIAREDKRAIHDFVAGTYVTHDEPETIVPDYLKGDI